MLIHLDGYSGVELAKKLEHNHKIVVEKYESENILLIMKFQNRKYEIDQTVSAIKTEILKMKKGSALKFPVFPTMIVKKKSAYKIGSNVEMIKLNKNAIGRIIAENVVPYPPGIPLIAKGEMFLSEHLQYLKALEKTKGAITVIMNDSNIKLIKVVKE